MYVQFDQPVAEKEGNISRVVQRQWAALDGKNYVTLSLLKSHVFDHKAYLVDASLSI